MVVAQAMRSKTYTDDLPVAYSHKYFEAFAFHNLGNEKADQRERIGLLVRYVGG